MQCQHCGAENSDAARNCSSCGKRLNGIGLRERSMNAERHHVSPRARMGRPTGPMLQSPDSVFRHTNFVKGSRLTGYASTETFTKPPASGSKPGTVREREKARASAHAAQPGRSEPHFGGSGAAFSVDPSSDEQQRQYAFYNQFNSPPTRPRPRIAYVLGVFAIGAVVGLTSAWLLRQPSRPALGKDIAHATRGAHVSDSQGAGSRVTKGIDPRELPYDGLPPRSTRQTAQTQPARINPEELPYAGLTSSGSSPRKEATPNKNTNTPQDLKSKQATAAMDENPTRVTPSMGVTKTVTAKVAKKHRSAHRRVAQDREIERIKQQAAEELKKKTENRGLVAEREEPSAHRSGRHRDAPAIADKFARTRAMLASCERASNFFRREKCKWRLCGDSWGQHGCPSYQMQAGPN
jgi:hypothetical protein